MAAFRDDLRRIGQVIARLNKREQALVGLRVSNDLSHREIADLMGMSEKSVRVAVHRALKKVRAAMEASE